MDPLLLLAILFMLVVLFGPLIAVEDRPAFKRPDRKPRRTVGPPW